MMRMTRLFYFITSKLTYVLDGIVYACNISVFYYQTFVLHSSKKLRVSFQDENDKSDFYFDKWW